jgi:multidrug/hemolysin transport system ATP-binding protein
MESGCKCIYNQYSRNRNIFSSDNHSKFLRRELRMEKIIEVSGLKKSYGSVRAVKGIDFYVDRGSLFAFLGPNGAGKSTTINMLGTLLKPDEGEVIIDGFTLGKEDEKIRSVIGMVFQDHVLDDLLTVRENMTIRGSFYHSNKKGLRAAVDYAVHITGVTSYQNRPYGKLSGGAEKTVRHCPCTG